MVVVSLDGVLPHQVTTEWDRFYRVTCETSLKGIGEGSVVVTTIYDTGYGHLIILLSRTPMRIPKSQYIISQTDPY